MYKVSCFCLSLAFATTANAGGYIPPVALPTEVPAEIVQQATTICAERPEICALILAIIIAGLASSNNDGGSTDIVLPVDPIPPVEPPICVIDCGTPPVDPLPPSPAPIPLPATGALMLAVMGVIAAMGRRRMVK